MRITVEQTFTSDLADRGSQKTLYHTQKKVILAKCRADSWSTWKNATFYIG